MPGEERKAAIRQIAEELFNNGSAAVVDGIFAADCVEHMRLPPGFPSGLAGLRIWLAELQAGFPDLHCTVEDVITEEEKAVVRLKAQGTHTGVFMGAPASGRRAVWTETHIWRFSKGKVVEHWADADQYGLAQQIGLINHRLRPVSEGWMV